MTKEYTDEMHEYFNKAWAGAYFDIVSGVIDRFPGWSVRDQTVMIYFIIEQLARRVGVIEDEDDQSDA